MQNSVNHLLVEDKWDQSSSISKLTEITITFDKMISNKSVFKVSNYNFNLPPTETFPAVGPKLI